MKTHIIVGCSGTNSIPWAIARQLASRGDRVLVTVRDPALLDMAQNNIDVTVCDVTDDRDIQRLAARTRDLDLASFTYSACRVQRASQQDLDAAKSEWHASFDVNVIGACSILSALEQQLRTNGTNILLIGSRAGLDHDAGSSITYAVTKAALHHLGLVLSHSLAPDCAVNVLAPGFVPTDRHHKILSPETIQQRVDRYQHQAALADIPRLQDLVSTAVMLIDTRSITGEIIRVDSGYHIGHG